MFVIFWQLEWQNMQNMKNDDMSDIFLFSPSLRKFKIPVL